MNQQELITKFNDFKGNIQHLLNKFIPHSHDDLKDSDDMRFDDHGADNYIDDLPLTLSRDPSPGIKFYSTENAEISRGAPKEDARGIDSFGEKDTFDFEEADEYQTNRDRNQNSDLSKRFYTNGLNLDDLGKQV